MISNSERPSRCIECFLTGATGVLGARLLKELLQSTSSLIHCLVRAESEEHAWNRLASSFRVYDPTGSLLLDFNKRVRPIKGEIHLAKMGLSESQYQSLQARISHTFHVAANTSLLAKFSRIEPVNVGGTSNVIQFVLGTQGQRLSYISTYTVMGRKTFDKNFVFREELLDVGQSFEHMNYQRSKFLAEKRVRETTSAGLQWKIFRPGQIFGEAKTGNYPQGDQQVSGLFYDIFKTAIETGVTFESETHFDVVPVDYVSQAIIKLSIDRTEPFEVYHLTNPDIKTYSEVVRLFANQGYEIRLVPEGVFKEMLVMGEIKKDGERYRSPSLEAFQAWFFRAGVSFRQSALTDCSLTQRLLKPLGVECPRINSKLIGVYVRKGVETGYFPQAVSPPSSNDHPFGRLRESTISSPGLSHV